MTNFNVRKLFALWVSLCLLASTISILTPTSLTTTSAIASQLFTDVNGDEFYADAAKILAENNILNGYPDGTFGADRDITRAEIAAVILRSQQIEPSSEGFSNPYHDVTSEHWAYAYIIKATQLKIIQGDGNGTFRPQDNVKYEEAIKIVVESVGLGAEAQNAGGWPDGYINVAQENNILTNVPGSKGQPSFRGAVAVMIYQGLLFQGTLSSTPPPDQTNIEFLSDVVDLFQETPSVLQYSSDGRRVTVSNDIITSTPTTGQIIVLPPDPYYPSGRAVKVVTATKSGELLDISVTEPQPDEVFSDCSFAMDFTPDPQKIVDLYNERQRMQSTQVTPINAANSPLTSDDYRVLPLAAANGDELVLSVESDGSLKIAGTKVLAGDKDNHISVEGEINLKFGRIYAEALGYQSWKNWSSIHVSIPMTTEMKLLLKGQLKKEKTWTLLPIPVPSPVPGVYLSIDLNLKLTVEGTIEIGFSNTVTTLCEMDYKLPFPAVIVPSARVVDGPNTKFELNLEVSGSLTFEFDTAIKIVGFDLIKMAPEYGIGIIAEFKPVQCDDINFAVHHLLKLTASIAELDWLTAKINILDEENAQIGEFHFSIGKKAFFEGRCTHDQDATMRVVVTWKGQAEDLDAHLVGPTQDGDYFHIYYGKPVYSVTEDDTEVVYAKFDTDDIETYGSESIRIQKLTDGIYDYYVQDYSNFYKPNSDQLGKSQAVVIIYNGNDEVLRTFDIPTDGGPSTIWHVFSIEVKDGKPTIVPVNVMGTEFGNTFLLAV